MVKAKKGKTNIYKKTVKYIWLAFAAIIVFIPIYVFLVSINLFNLFGGLPSLKVLENPKSELASELYSVDNVLLGKYFRENRSPVSYEELSPNLINALIATEDYRFENHSGIDFRSLARVFIYTIVLRRDAGGGSTLSQQLAKNLFETRSEKYKGLLSNIPGLRFLIIKTKEWIVAVQLERSYTKKEILSMYLNTVNFGNNSYGIKVAAQTYFNKSPDSLNIQESALLVGLLKGPSRFDPIRNAERAHRRRNVVLNQMEKYSFFEKTVCDSIKKLPVVLDFSVESHNQGFATYFRSVIRSFLLSWTKEHGYDLFEDGLKIYTTIDSRLQAHAEAAIEEHMIGLQKQFDKHWEGRNPWIDKYFREIKGFIEKASKRTNRYKQLLAKYGEGADSIDIVMNLPRKMRIFSWEGEIDTVMSPIDSLKYYKRFLHAGFMAMDPHSGHIKAWVGGINFKYFKYDHVKQGVRQPGSTFKPIVYASVIDNGYSPCYEVVDAPVTYKLPAGNTWTPKNAGGKYSGERMTIRQAMARSVNSITAYVMKKVGPETVVEYASRLGVKSPLDPVPALCLGSSDVSVYELVGAYSTFANKGIWTEPFYITRIEDKNGNLLQEFVPKTAEAISEETAYLMLHMLKGTTQESGGTALGLDYKLRANNEIGAKTGTTSNYSDGWFMGVTKNLTAGVWVGGEDRSIHFRNMRLGQGANMAMPIWENFMLKVYDDENLSYEKGAFAKPEQPLSIETDCDKYKDQSFGAEDIY